MSPLAHRRNTHHSLASTRLTLFPTCMRVWGTVVCLLLTVSIGAFADRALPENRPSPAFTLKDVDGASHTPTEYRGRSVVVLFACGCRWCHDFGIEWAQMQRSGVLADAVGQKEPDANAASKAPVTLVVYMGEASAARAYAASVGLDLKQTVLLPDADYKVTRQYHALPCPRLFVLDANGLLRYVNNHSDDAPQKAAASLLVAKTIDGLRRTTLPPPISPPATHPTKRPVPKTGKGGKNGKK